MNEYTKVVVESDSKGRINISAVDEKGCGHGYRLAGPKYGYGGGSPLASKTLDGGDIDELRCYANIWDEINLADEPAITHALSEALRRYLHNRASALKFPQYEELPHNVERAEATRRNLIDATAALLDGLVSGGPS